MFKKLYSVLIKPFCVFICILLANLTLNIIVWHLISGVQPLMSPVCIHVVTWIAWVLCTFHLPAWHTGACIAAVPASKGDSNLVHLPQVVADCNIKKSYTIQPIWLTFLVNTLKYAYFINEEKTNKNLFFILNTQNTILFGF